MPVFSGSYRFPVLVAAPGTPTAGQVYYNSTTNQAMVYTGTAWTPLGSTMKDPTDDWKTSVKAASTANITISPGGVSLVVDTYTTVNGDRILLKDQTTIAQNGIYVVGGVGSSVTLTRAADADAALEVSGGLTVYVTRGSVHRDTLWSNASNSVVTLGTDPITFTRMIPSYTPGNWREPWLPTSGIYSNMARNSAAGTYTLPAAATNTFHGGGIISAGNTISSVTVFCVAAGATITIKHFALVRQSDRAVMAVTTNNTVALTANAFNTINFAATWTPTVDTPVWLVIGFAATTAMSLASSAVVPNAALLLQAPIHSASGGTTPTATPPAAAAILTAPATGLTQTAYFHVS